MYLFFTPKFFCLSVGILILPKIFMIVIRLIIDKRLLLHFLFILQKEVSVYENGDVSSFSFLEDIFPLIYLKSLVLNMALYCLCSSALLLCKILVKLLLNLDS